MSDLSDLQQKVIAYRDARDWKQFHNPKDLAISLLSEATELLDEFKWKTPDEIAEHLKTSRESVVDEVMDVLHNVLLIAHELDIDIPKEFERKMRKNEARYPVDKARGKHRKYSEL